ncbi:hypothetical protein ABB37_02111 [Leptomonas pyrrhocoris]|uniref:Uncharacterized protein n=1 Tax=Leptomonas pyrrhocoris TaxID=157538 RepID=A0A0N1J575_LEPPY|nr:hypothetical protein ABB37_02111 [Leptomonas pyrrhocoris]KPA83964.1 hypothetical protein ABB37_02111 [Leptomonas pyrrhocoris]|eukprot:XP_015662403.1 hypothetical protein ABB37_02111 [Leptomonas pyrrhocoris]
MVSFATRAASLLLTLAMALCCIPTGYAAPEVSTYNMIAGVSGSSYFWSVVSDMIQQQQMLQSMFKAALQDDLQTAAGTDVTVTYKDILVNASAMYVKYTAAVAGPSPTQAEVEARVAADATFPKLTEILTQVKEQVSEIADLVPTNLSVTFPLPVDPNADSSSSGYEVVDSVQYDVLVLFSGPPPAWTTALEANRHRVSADVAAAVQALMDSSKLRNDVEVRGMHVLAEDASTKSMGSGAGGLLVRLNVVSSATTAMTSRHLSTTEYASVLLLLDTTTLSATFRALSGSTATVVVEETTSVAATGVSDECDASCKGMIVMTAVVVALVAIVVVLTLIAICCPCCCVRSPREDYVVNGKLNYAL